MSEMRRTGGSRSQLWLYVIVSLMLAIAPLWVRQMIVSDVPSDAMGYDGDIISWLWLVVVLALVDALMQILVFFLSEFASRSTKTLVISSSVVLWVASMWGVHILKIP